MKDQIDSLPDLINADQKLYGLCLIDSPNLYNEMIGLKDARAANYTSSRTSISNTEILFNSTNRSTMRDINFEIPDSKHKSCYQKLLISHDSTWKSIVDIIVLIMVNISSIIILYDYCFLETENENNTQSFVYNPVYYAIEICFAIFIILQFFQTYQDHSTLLIVTDFKKIALRYMKRWFFIDLLSIIPFELFMSSSDSSLKYCKMIRFLRLPKFIQTIDVKRFDNIATSFLTKGESENASKRLMVIFNIRYFFKIVRLMIMASILAYVLGCVWYLICLSVFNNRFSIGYPQESTFFTYYKIYQKPPLKKLMLSCYYVLTGLTTVGYGDYNAQNEYEKIFGITVMFLGVAIFSYVMSEFSDQINVYNKTFGDRDQGSALRSHISLLNEFTPNQPFNNELITKIEKHFKFFWKNNRMFSIDKNDKYLINLPKDLKISLVEYFWYDIFAKYNNLLLYRKYKNVYYKYYYELSFLLMPRLFNKDEIIYNEDEEVEELYLIMGGIVSMGLSKYKNIIKHRTNFFSGDHLGAYYCLYNVNAEFECVAVEECKLYGINKIELLKLLKDYPEIEDQIREIQYSLYKSVKNQMENGIKKEINEYNNKVANEEDKIDYESKPMVDFEANKNGMTINNALVEEIKEKEDEINNLNEILEKKYEEGNNKLKELKKNYSELIKECKEKYGFNFSPLNLSNNL
jgi:hypothetical protein